MNELERTLLRWFSDDLRMIGVGFLVGLSTRFVSTTDFRRWVFIGVWVFVASSLSYYADRKLQRARSGR